MKCSEENCEREGVYGVKVDTFSAPGESAVTSYIQLPVCEAHRLPGVKLLSLVLENWEYICFGVEQLRQPRPDFDLTEASWVPIDEVTDEIREAQGIVQKVHHRN